MRCLMPVAMSTTIATTTEPPLDVITPWDLFFAAACIAIEVNKVGTERVDTLDEMIEDATVLASRMLARRNRRGGR